MNHEIQSDLTVHIFHSLHLTVDFSRLTGEKAVDPEAAFSEMLTLKLGQTWLLSNSHGEFQAGDFHRKYLRLSQSVGNSFLSIVYFDPGLLYSAIRPYESFFSSLAAINRVTKRRVLLVADKGMRKNEVSAEYVKTVSSVVGGSTRNLFVGKVYDMPPSFTDFCRDMVEEVARL